MERFVLFFVFFWFLLCVCICRFFVMRLSKCVYQAPTPLEPDLLLSGDFGFWILGILDFGFGGFWILDFGFGGFWILDLVDFVFWILGILDFGFC